MGKPSTTQLSKNLSTNSIKSTMSKDKMLARVTKRKHRRTQRCINKMLNKIRSTHQNISQSSSMTSISIIDLEDSNATVMPNAVNNEVSIVIPDDEQQVSTPMFGHHTSTPKRSPFLEDVAYSNYHNSQSSLNSKWFHTIDLTGSTISRNDPTIIEIEDAAEEVTLVSASNASSMSADSEITILKQPVSRRLKNFTQGLRNLKHAEKGKLLDMITQTLLEGCAVPSTALSSVPNLQQVILRAPESAEDTYIKSMILAGKASRSSIGSNIYHPDRQRNFTGKRMVVIDGSNVAIEHGRGQLFSVRGLQICITYFIQRGHVVKAFVPRFRCKFGMSSDPRLLDFLERQGLVIYTPSRQIHGRNITPYDDRYIIQCAAEFEGVVVSGDNYRDLEKENPRWREVIERRLLPFTWVDDMIMFPKDPLGRHGPTLEQFLMH